MLSDLLAAANGDRITIETDETRAMIKWEKSKTKLPTLPIDEFPSVPAFKFKGTKIAGKDFASAIKSVAFSTLPDENRPVLHTISISTEKERTILASTDGFRLSVKRLHCDLKLKALIPIDAMRTLAALCKDEEEITIRPDGDARVIFTGTGWQMLTMLIEGDFPDYNVVMPKTHNTAVTVASSALRIALQQMKAISSEHTELAVTSLLAVTGWSEAESTEAESPIDAEVAGPEQRFYLNTQYLSEAVSVAGEKVTFNIIAEKSPIVITGDDPDWKHVIMPVHTSRS